MDLLADGRPEQIKDNQIVCVCVNNGVMWTETHSELITELIYCISFFFFKH